jgi:MFS family permease
MRAPLPRAFWVLWVGTLINRIGGFVLPFLALFLSKGRGVSVELTGLIVSLYGAGMMVAGLAGGILADKIGRRRVMLVSLLGGPPLMVALGVSRSIGAIALLAPLVGAVYELYRPAVGAMVSDVVGSDQRLRAFGLLYWAVNLGAGIAPVLGGLLAHRGYEPLFVADAATTFLYGGIIWASVPETRPAPATTGEAPTMRRVLADRVFVAFCAITCVMAILYHQGWTALSLDMIRRGFSEASYGAVVSVNGFLIIALQPLAGRLLERWDRARVLALSACFVAIGLGMNAVAPSAVWLGVAVGVWTLGEIANAPTGSAIVADLASPDLRGRYQGLYSLSWSSAGALAPIIGGAVLGYSRTLLWVACSFVSMLLVGAYAILGLYLRRR